MKFFCACTRHSSRSMSRTYEYLASSKNLTFIFLSAAINKAKVFSKKPDFKVFLFGKKYKNYEKKVPRLIEKR